MMDDLQIADIKNLSTDELRQHLSKYGLKGLPITATTRGLYEKKLATFITADIKKKLNGDDGASGSRTDVSFSNETIAAPSPRRGRKSLPVPNRPFEEYKRTDKLADNGQSTPKSARKKLEDDSDDNLSTARRSTRRQTINLVPASRRTPSPAKEKPASLATFSSAEEDEDGEDENGTHEQSAVKGLLGKVTKPFLPSSRVAPPRPLSSHSRINPPSMTNVSPMPGLARQPIRRLSSRISTRKSMVSSYSEQISGGSSLANFSDSDIEADTVEPSYQATRLLRHRKVTKLPELRDSAPRLASSLTTQNLDGYQDKPPGFLSSLMPSSLNSSLTKWIPLTILAVIALFFLVIIGLYCHSRLNFAATHPASKKLNEKMDQEFEALSKSVTVVDCGDSLTLGKDELCISSEKLKHALVVLKHIGRFFESRVIRFYCENDETVGIPNYVPKKDVQANVVSQLFPREEEYPIFSDESTDKNKTELDVGRRANIYKAFADALNLLQLNPQFKIQVVKAEHTDQITHLKIDPNNFPIKWPVACKIKLALVEAAWKVAIALVVIGIAFVMYQFANSKKESSKKEEMMFYDLVEKCVELLQSPDEPKSLAVLHVRDSLISAQEKKNPVFVRVWDRVVKFIESNESRIKVETETIDGEPFKTWKWVALSSSDGSSPGANISTMKTGNIEWQGQAFNETKCDALEGTKKRTSPAKTENFKAPTNFLKIRQMFDRETATNAPLSWKRDVRQAILQKCCVDGEDGTHGIIHMSIDERSLSEGLVYLRCKNADAASRCFKQLHGWWCEKRLISVRFLKDYRYYQRFPEAKDAAEPLHFEQAVSNGPIVEDEDV
ncbi:Inner nuclear membrane protein Man1 [Halotydeus destructor]|nr:Inner nuclear membrane protein Man1 [Halotydeus destructor]